MNDLREVQNEPEFLEKDGFIYREEESTDSVRWVWYEKAFESIESQLRFIIQVEFEMDIYDEPFASYAENRTYSFNGVYLIVVDRQMQRWDNRSYDEETEISREIDRYKVNIHTLGRLRSLCNMLGGKK